MTIKWLLNFADLDKSILGPASVDSSNKKQQNMALTSQKDVASATPGGNVIPTVVIVIAVAFAILVIAVPIVWFLLRRRYRRYKAVPGPVNGDKSAATIQGTTKV